MPFEKQRSTYSIDDIDDTELIKNLGVAGDSVSLFIKLGKGFAESHHMRAEIDQKVETIFKERDLTLSLRVRRTYTILLVFTFMVSVILLYPYLCLYNLGAAC